MAKTPTSTDQYEALQRICDAYGADPARWPDKQRAALAGLLDTDEAAAILAEAQSLDGFLNAATAPRMAEDLQRRIIAAYEAPKPGAGVFDWLSGVFSVSRIVPAGALAGLGALGLVSGVMTAPAGAALSPEAEAIAYIEAWSLSPAAEGEVQWDVD
ncbi:MAG: hypothetical protein AAFW68_01095 [Pseudomonadota bacterium]